MVNEYVHVLDANGGEVRRQCAMVHLEVGYIKDVHRVVVAPSDSLKGNIPLALDLRNEVHFQLLVNYRNGVYKSVCVVQTRSEGYVEKEELEAEKEFLREIAPEMLVPDLLAEAPDVNNNKDVIPTCGSKSKKNVDVPIKSDSSNVAVEDHLSLLD